MHSNYYRPLHFCFCLLFCVQWEQSSKQAEHCKSHENDFEISRSCLRGELSTSWQEFQFLSRKGDTIDVLLSLVTGAINLQLALWQINALGFGVRCLDNDAKWQD